MSGSNWHSLKSQLDPDDMYRDILEFPKHLADAKRIIDATDLPDIDSDEVDHVVVCGMGGSAIGADLVRGLLEDELSIPMVVCRHYRLPAFVGKKTLVIGSSYSGNTEETLSAVEQAADAGAKIICATTGGKLGQMADRSGWKRITVPPGMMPRAALAYSFVPLLTAMSRLGFAPGCDDDLDKAITEASARLEKYSIEIDDNPAMQLANRIHGRIPTIYAAPDRFAVVAVRFKGQICENSKQLAFANVYPEFNHNELVGWESYESFADRLIAVTLRDQDDHPRVAARMAVVDSWLAERSIERIELASNGGSALSRMMSLIQLGDFASFYLAMLNGVDPTPVDVIDHLKTELEKI